MAHSSQGNVRNEVKSPFKVFYDEISPLTFPPLFSATHSVSSLAVCQLPPITQLQQHFVSSSDEMLDRRKDVCSSRISRHQLEHNKDSRSDTVDQNRADSLDQGERRFKSYEKDLSELPLNSQTFQTGIQDSSQEYIQIVQNKLNPEDQNSKQNGNISGQGPQPTLRLSQLSDPCVQKMERSSSSLLALAAASKASVRPPVSHLGCMTPLRPSSYLSLSKSRQSHPVTYVLNNSLESGVSTEVHLQPHSDKITNDEIMRNVDVASESILQQQVTGPLSKGPPPPPGPPLPAP
jgi:hypothetical protein